MKKLYNCSKGKHIQPILKALKIIGYKLHAYLSRTICVICYRWHDSEAVCEICIERLPWIQTCCSRCSYPLEQSQQVCGACSSYKQDLSIHCLFRYEGFVKTMIYQFKSLRQLGWGPFFGGLLAMRLEILKIKPQALIAVPSTPLRIKQRGFNPTMELVTVLATLSGIPVWDGVRCVDRAPQKHLKREQRLKVSSSSFYLNKNIHFSHVLVVDDVVTTMATVNALSELLYKHGVKTIEILAIARTVKQNQ